METEESMNRAAQREVSKEDQKILVVAKEIMHTVDEIMNRQSLRIMELEMRLSRYDRAFEAMFREEMDRRLNGKQDTMGLDKPYHDPAYALNNKLSSILQSQQSGVLR